MIIRQPRCNSIQISNAGFYSPFFSDEFLFFFFSPTCVCCKSKAVKFAFRFGFGDWVSLLTTNKFTIAKLTPSNSFVAIHSTERHKGTNIQDNSQRLYIFPAAKQHSKPQNQYIYIYIYCRIKNIRKYSFCFIFGDWLNLYKTNQFTIAKLTSSNSFVAIHSTERYKVTNIQDNSQIL